MSDTTYTTNGFDTTDPDVAEWLEKQRAADSTRAHEATAQDFRDEQAFWDEEEKLQKSATAILSDRRDNPRQGGGQDVLTRPTTPDLYGGKVGPRDNSQGMADMSVGGLGRLYGLAERGLTQASETETLKPFTRTYDSIRSLLAEGTDATDENVVAPLDEYAEHLTPGFDKAAVSLLSNMAGLSPRVAEGALATFDLREPINLTWGISPLLRGAKALPGLTRAASRGFERGVARGTARRAAREATPLLEKPLPFAEFTYAE